MMIRLTALLLLMTSCKTSQTALLSESTDTKAYSDLTADDPLPDFLNGPGTLIMQATHNAVIDGQEVTSQYRAWFPPRVEDFAGAPVVVFFHGNTGSNYGPVFLNEEKITSGSAKKKNGGLGQEYPTLEQTRYEAAQDADSFWNQAIFVAILTPSFSDNVSSKGEKMSTWGSQQSSNSGIAAKQLSLNGRFAQDLLEKKIFASTAPAKGNLNKTFFVGQSGGGLFLGAEFLPAFGERYRGGAIFLCGTEVPATDTLRSKNFDKLRSQMHWHLQTTLKEASTKPLEIDEKNLKSSLRPIIVDSTNFYGAKWMGKAWQSVTEDQWYGKDGDAFRSLNFKNDTGKSFSVQFDGDGTHCNFATDSQPQIIADIIGKWDPSLTR